MRQFKLLVTVSTSKGVALRDIEFKDRAQADFAHSQINKQGSISLKLYESSTNTQPWAQDKGS